MKSRSIIFSTPMVRALLDGRKTQTRRIAKLPKWCDQVTSEAQIYREPPVPDRWAITARANPHYGQVWSVYCPYGYEGDELWVRETWAQKQNQLNDSDYDSRYIYRADSGARALDNGIDLPWRPSIFMPRRASRITLRITSVRAERLQDISAKDAIAEGIDAPQGDDEINAPDAYRELWLSINGAGSWDANPWVWVIAFERLSAERNAT